MMTDGKYAWRSDVIYYVEKYNMSLLNDFIKHVLSWYNVTMQIKWMREITWRNILIRCYSNSTLKNQGAFFMFLLLWWFTHTDEALSEAFKQYPNGCFRLEITFAEKGGIRSCTGVIGTVKCFVSVRGFAPLSNKTFRISISQLFFAFSVSHHWQMYKNKFFLPEIHESGFFW